MGITSVRGRCPDAVQIRIRLQITIALRNAVIQNSHGVLDGVADAPVGIALQLTLCIPQDHHVQKMQA